MRQHLSLLPIEDMPVKTDGPLISTQPLRDWIARQDQNTIDDRLTDRIRKHLSKDEAGFHVIDRMCCRLGAPMAFIYGELYWQTFDI
jgi:hypothetical protein